jgi:hypothetical protein
MKTLSIQLAALLVALATQAAAQAQVPGKVAKVQPLHSVQSDYSLGLRSRYYMPNPYGPRHHHASTAAEGYLRGMAARVQAQGVYNRLTAEARVIHTEAERREIENREMAAETYFAMRAANLEARDAERRPRPTAADLARFSEQAKPDRLSPGELNATTGDVSWPILLQTDEFIAFRAELEEVFNARATNGEIEANQQTKADQATKAMLVELKKLVRQTNPMDYTMARRFIKSLAYEVHLPTS